MIIIASYSHTFSHSFGVLIYWNISQHTRNVWKIIHTFESPREEDQSRSSARLDTQTRQKSPAAVQMIDLAAVLAKTKNTVYSWHHQQHPKLLCGASQALPDDVYSQAAEHLELNQQDADSLQKGIETQRCCNF